MLDIKFVRENPDAVKENIKKKFQDAKLPLVDEVIEKDAQYRAALKEVEALKAARNKLSKANGPQYFSQLAALFCSIEATGSVTLSIGSGEKQQVKEIVLVFWGWRTNLCASADSRLKTACPVQSNWV